MTSPSIQRLLTEAAAWRIQDDGSFEVTYLDDDLPVGPHHISTAQLEACQTGLTKYLGALAQNRLERRFPYLDGIQVGTVIDQLADNYFTFRDFAGLNHIYDFISRVTISKTAEGYGTVRIDGNRPRFVTVNFKGDVLTVAAGEVTDYLDTGIDIIDAIYPGWLAKYELGVELGVEEQSLFREVFKVGTTLGCTLPSNIEMGI